MTRRCIHIPNGIICVAKGRKGPSKKDMAAVNDLLKAIKNGTAPMGLDLSHLDDPTNRLKRKPIKVVINHHTKETVEDHILKSLETKRAVFAAMYGDLKPYQKEILDKLDKLPKGTKLRLDAPLHMGKRGHYNGLNFLIQDAHPVNRTVPQEKNLTLTWQPVHAKDPKRHTYRDAIKAAVKCDRVTELAFTPSGLLISGKCHRTVNKLGRRASMGYFQILAP